MRTLIVKCFTGILAPVVLASGLLVLSGCGDLDSGASNTGGLAPVTPSAVDKKAMDRTKEGIMKSQAKNK